MKKNRVIAYIRVSTDTQDTQNQKIKILEYAQKSSMTIDEFIEVTISSTKKQDQRKITELKDKLNSGDTVITTEYSRLHRNQVEAFVFLHEQLNKDINFIFVNQPELTTYGVPTALKSLLFSIYGYVAQTERETNSTRTKMGMKKAETEGRFAGRPVGSKGQSKLDGLEKDIAEMLDADFNKAQIVRTLKKDFDMKISRPTLDNFLKTRAEKIEKFRKANAS
jgi:DNA invertase Pin-like site-specific DNA recombinase